MKSGGSGGSAPNRPGVDPRGVVPYGSTGAASTKFNPQYNSVLPVDAAGAPVQTQTAQLTDPMRMESGNRTPLLEQQEAMPIASSPGQQDPRRNALATLMRVFGAGSMPGIMGGSYRGQLGSSGGGGYTTSNPSTGRSSSAMGGKAY